MSDHISRREQRKDFRKVGTGRTTAIRIPAAQTVSEKDSGSTSDTALNLNKGRRTGLEVNSENIQKDGDGFLYAGEFFSKAKNQVLSNDTNFKFNLDTSTVPESRDITVNSSILTTTTSASAMDYSENLSDYDSPSHGEDEEDIEMSERQSSQQFSSVPPRLPNHPTPLKSVVSNNIATPSIDSNITDRRVIPMEIATTPGVSEALNSSNTKSAGFKTPSKESTTPTKQSQAIDKDSQRDDLEEELELSPIVAAPNSKVLGFKSPSSVFQSTSPVNPNDSIFHFPEYSLLSDTPAKDNLSISKIVENFRMSDDEADENKTTRSKESKEQNPSTEKVVVDDSENEDEAKSRNKSKKSGKKKTEEKSESKPKGKRGRPPKNKPNEEQTKAEKKNQPENNSESSSAANNASSSQIINLDDDLEQELLAGHTKKRELSLSIIQERKRERRLMEEEHNLPDEIGGFIDLDMEDSNFIDEEEARALEVLPHEDVAVEFEEKRNETPQPVVDEKEPSSERKDENAIENVIEEPEAKEQKKSKRGGKKKERTSESSSKVKETKSSESSSKTKKDKVSSAMPKSKSVQQEDPSSIQDRAANQPLESPTSKSPVQEEEGISESRNKSKKDKTSKQKSITETPKSKSTQQGSLEYSPELGSSPAPQQLETDNLFDDPIPTDFGGFDVPEDAHQQEDPSEQTNDQENQVLEGNTSTNSMGEANKEVNVTSATDIIQKKTRGRKRKSIIAQNNLSSNTSTVETPYIRKKVSERTPARYDLDMEEPEIREQQEEYLKIDKSFVAQQGEESTNNGEESVLPDDLATEEPLPPVSTPNKSSKKRKRGSNAEDHETRQSTRVRQKPLEFWKNQMVDSNDTQIVKIPKTPVQKKRKVNVASFKEIGEFPVMIDGKEELVEVAKNKNSLEEKFYKFEDANNTSSSQTRLTESDSKEADFSVQVGFHNPDFKSGILKLYPSTTKPLANTKQHTEVFYVVSGVADVTIYKTTFKINTGGFFYVPPHNSYTVTNPSETHECKLCYFVNFS